MSIFKSPEAHKAMTAWHEKFRARLGVPTESRTISTQLGETHLLICGPESATPLVLLHGAMASSAHALGEILPLTDQFRIYAIDVIGQSPLSEDTRPNPNTDDYGHWLKECLDVLGLDKVCLLGVSWGGGVALRFASLYPERLVALSLIVPAGLVAGSAKDGFLKMGFPLMRYQLFPTTANRDALLKNLFTEPDPTWGEYLGEAFRSYKFDFNAPRLLRDDELSKLTAPVQVIAAENDISFPGEALLARARILFPNLRSAVLLSGAKHTPSFSSEARCALAKTISGFLLHAEAG
ncbi:MAG: alpha/beta hydrolase [Armatimonas sp.]